MNGQTLYHGSLIIVQHPLVNVGRKDLDFGQGFYTTDLKAQAKNWASTLQDRTVHRSEAYVNIYDVDVERFKSSIYKRLKFEKYDRAWLEFICASRRGQRPWQSFDIIEGGIANDSVIDTVDAYMSELIDAETALGRLTYHEPNNQICILNQEVVDSCLRFVEAINIKSL